MLRVGSPPYFTSDYGPLDQPYETLHDVVNKWKHLPRYWPFVRGIYRSPVNTPHKGQWRRALMFSLICAWINGKQWWRWWFGTPSRPLWRHCNDFLLSLQNSVHASLNPVDCIEVDSTDWLSKMWNCNDVGFSLKALFHPAIARIITWPPNA